MTDSFLVLMLPGAGDELQGLKKGVLELADIVAVNKTDGDNRARANSAAASLKAALNILASSGESPPPPVLTFSALTGRCSALWGAVPRIARGSAPGLSTSAAPSRYEQWGAGGRATARTPAHRSQGQGKCPLEPGCRGKNPTAQPREIARCSAMTTRVLLAALGVFPRAKKPLRRSRARAGPHPRPGRAEVEILRLCSPPSMRRYRASCRGCSTRSARRGVIVWPRWRRPASVETRGVTRRRDPPDAARAFPPTRALLANSPFGRLVRRRRGGGSVRHAASAEGADFTRCRPLLCKPAFTFVSIRAAEAPAGNLIHIRPRRSRPRRRARCKQPSMAPVAHRRGDSARTGGRGPTSSLARRPERHNARHESWITCPSIEGAGVAIDRRTLLGLPRRCRDPVRGKIVQRRRGRSRLWRRRTSSA